MTHLRNRYQGTLVGVLAGDALGAPYETWFSETVLADYAKRGGLVPFAYPDPWGVDGIFPAGRPTDDSELTAALAESLVECGCIDLEDQYRRFKSTALQGKSFLWDGVVKGFGGTTRETLAAETYAESLDLKDLPLRVTNGSLMRSAPLALFFHDTDMVNIDSSVRNSSHVTHRHETAMESCVVFVHILDALLNGGDIRYAVAHGVSHTDDWSLAHQLQDLTVQPIIPKNFPDRGNAVLTLQAALWALLTTSSFEEGISAVIALGGDTDTYAAVAGALLGATYGIEGIPAEWISVLRGGERMKELADLLYERNHS
ncbi:MAG: ADP-ribosylglycohydrolase family protein [Candidatus Paceibacterota bacterium]